MYSVVRNVVGKGEPDVENFGEGGAYPYNRDLQTVTCPECGWEG